MQNSLYGKLGQRNFPRTIYVNKLDYEMLTLEDWEELLETDGNKKRTALVQQNIGKDFDESIVHHVQQVNDSILQIEYYDAVSSMASCGSLVRIASLVTALARTKLVKLIYEIGPESVYYCDTDSLVFATDKLPNLKSFVIGNHRGNISD